jgi:hypothetical protein
MNLQSQLDDTQHRLLCPTLNANIKGGIQQASVFITPNVSPTHSHDTTIGKNYEGVCTSSLFIINICAFSRSNKKCVAHVGIVNLEHASQNWHNLLLNLGLFQIHLHHLQIHIYSTSLISRDNYVQRCRTQNANIRQTIKFKNHNHSPTFDLSQDVHEQRKCHKDEHNGDGK